MDTRRLVLVVGGVALAISLVIAGTVALLLTRGDRIGRRVMQVGDRIARAGGSHGLVTVEEVEAIATVTCAEQAAASSERAIVVRRK